MAGPLSPVLPEADVRVRPYGGYWDNTYNVLSSGLSDAANAGTRAYARYQEDTAVDQTDMLMKQFGGRTSQFIQTANQTNDMTGRPIKSRQVLQGERAQLIADAVATGNPDVVRFVTTSIDNSLGGELGLIGGNISLQAAEAEYMADMEAGLAVLPEGLSEEEYRREGNRQRALNKEIEDAGNRIALAKQQIELDNSTFNYNQSRIKQEGDLIAAKMANEVLQPFFNQIAQSDMQDPDVIAANQRALVQAQAEVAGTLRQTLTALGIGANQQNDIISTMNQQFQYQQSGVELMAGLDAARLDQISAQTQLSEVEMGTYIGKLISLFGRAPTANLLQNAQVIDPKVAVGLGNSMAAYLSGAEIARGSLGLGRPENFEATIPQATTIIGNRAPLNEPAELKTLADASRELTAGAIESDFNSQINAIDMLSDPTYLENLKKTGDRQAISQVMIFNNEMASRLATMMGQITQQVPDITITPNPDGTITPDIESIVESLKDVAGGFTKSPAFAPEGWGAATWMGPLGMLAEGFNEITERTTYSKLEQMVDSYNKAVGVVNDLAPLAPRGVRNNNPGNIRSSNSNNWQGEVPSNDPAFEQFRGPADGLRAMGRVIQNNSNLTVEQLINRYAPPTENDTQAYVDAVRNAGIDTTKSVSEVNKLDLVKTMIRQETGVMPFNDDFIQGVLGS